MAETKKAIDKHIEVPVFCKECGTLYDPAVGKSGKHKFIDTLISLKLRRKKNGSNG
jgi:hypothetical protein